MKFFVSSFAALALVSCTSTTETAQVTDAVEPSSSEPSKVLEKEKESDFDESLITGVAVERVFELRETGQLYLIDTRSPLFFNGGHISGAVNLPIKKFDAVYSAKESEIQQALADGKVVVLYCASEKCPDSYTMAVEFAKKGIRSSVFKGGWRLWKQTGLE